MSGKESFEPVAGIWSCQVESSDPPRQHSATVLHIGFQSVRTRNRDRPALGTGFRCPESRPPAATTVSRRKNFRYRRPALLGRRRSCRICDGMPATNQTIPVLRAQDLFLRPAAMSDLADYQSLLLDSVASPVGQ